MCRLIYYAACSVDGYIAGPKGEIDWLSAFESEGEDYGYKAFYDSIDALLMGRNTFDQLQSFGAWPYPDKPCWVVTTRKSSSDRPNIRFTTLQLPALLAQLQAQHMNRVWLVGGSRLAAAFREEDLISDYIITLLPVILGDGIPLLETTQKRDNLTLKDYLSFGGGVLQLHYVKI